MLIKNNIVSEQFGPEELFYDDSRNPRTAICKTEDDKLVFFITDGRSDVSGGTFFNETGQILHSIGCVDAINLDGGGSSCLLADYQIVNSPSDKTGPRPVTSAILVVDKHKKKSYRPHHK